MCPAVPRTSGGVSLGAVRVNWSGWPYRVAAMTAGRATFGASFVNAFLEKIFASGDWLKLYQQTIGKVAQGSQPTPPKIGSVPGS